MQGALLCCPAYPLADRFQFESALIAARRLGVRAGFSVVEAPGLGDFAPGRGAQRPVAARQADFQAALGHDLLLAARGGSGCIDLVPDALAAHRLPRLIGYSDLTVLHACWLKRGRCDGVYGLMPAVPHGERAFASTATLLRGEVLRPDPDHAPTAEVLRPGRAEGPLVAACLRILAALVGTPAMPDLRGCIIALEDIDERPYQIDRALWQLHASGALGGITGLVFGSFPCEKPAEDAGPSVLDICRTWAERLSVPALAGLPFGHDTDPIALPCGGGAVLDCYGSGWKLTAHCRPEIPCA